MAPGQVSLRTPKNTRKITQNIPFSARFQLIRTEFAARFRLVAKRRRAPSAKQNQFRLDAMVARGQLLDYLSGRPKIAVAATD
jgi:hypothetical protein